MKVLPAVLVEYVSVGKFPVDENWVAKKVNKIWCSVIGSPFNRGENIFLARY